MVESEYEQVEESKVAQEPVKPPASRKAGMLERIKQKKKEAQERVANSSYLLQTETESQQDESIENIDTTKINSGSRVKRPKAGEIEQGRLEAYQDREVS